MSTWSLVLITSCLKYQRGLVLVLTLTENPSWGDQCRFHTLELRFGRICLWNFNLYILELWEIIYTYIYIPPPRPPEGQRSEEV